MTFGFGSRIATRRALPGRRTPFAEGGEKTGAQSRPGVSDNLPKDYGRFRELCDWRYESRCQFGLSPYG